MNANPTIGVQIRHSQHLRTAVSTDVVTEADQILAWAQKQDLERMCRGWAQKMRPYTLKAREGPMHPMNSRADNLKLRL